MPDKRNEGGTAQKVKASMRNGMEGGLEGGMENEGEMTQGAGLADGERPRPEWVRGTCPECGDDLVSNCYFIAGRGYLICWECWSGLGDTPTCRYRKVIEPAASPPAAGAHEKHAAGAPE